MARLEGFEDGDSLYLARVRLDNDCGAGVVGLRVDVEAATVYSAEHGLVRVGDKVPRERYFTEVTFRTAGEAWTYCAARLIAASAKLQARARECLAEAEAGVAQKQEVA